MLETKYGVYICGGPCYGHQELFHSRRCTRVIYFIQVHSEYGVHQHSFENCFLSDLSSRHSVNTKRKSSCSSSRSSGANDELSAVVGERSCQ